MSRNNKHTSQKAASLAASTLANPNASKIQKSLAASALSQATTNKQTGSKMEDVASKVLQSNKYGEDTKALAATVLSQANKER